MMNIAAFRKVIDYVKPLERIYITSIKLALKWQKLDKLSSRLVEIIPDISTQYSGVSLQSKYKLIKVRGQHAFQVNLVNKAIQLLDEKNLTIVDIGDSAGTHLTYVKALNAGRNISCLSVNIDPEAVNKIRGMGIEAICARAEDVKKYDVGNIDIIQSFEMLEHLLSPVLFLHALATNTRCHYFVVTVPYVSRSRVGLGILRKGIQKAMNAESVHIFELSPDDWRMTFKFTGWDIVHDEIYYQYPRIFPLDIALKNIWAARDFEGFYGAILRPDQRWSSLYSDWMD